jgi:hypothetical protein
LKTTRISSVHLDSVVSELRETIPGYDDIVHESEIFMETIYSPDQIDPNDDDDDDDNGEFFDALSFESNSIYLLKNCIPCS